MSLAGPTSWNVQLLSAFQLDGHDSSAQTHLLATEVLVFATVGRLLRIISTSTIRQQLTSAEWSL